MFFNFFEQVNKHEIRIRIQVDRTYFFKKIVFSRIFFERGPGIEILDLDKLDWVFKKVRFLRLPLISSV